ncbi:MAG: GAF domain-containing protein, partial [Proteobacteria bacterium]
MTLETNIKCEDEPIHIPEAIQSFGYLIAVDPATNRMAIYSDNMEELFKDWDVAKTQLFFELLEDDSALRERITTSFSKAKAANVRLPIDITFKKEFLKDSDYDEYFAVVYESSGYMVIEVEPAVTFNGKIASRQATKIYSLNTTPRFHESGTIKEMAHAIAEMVRSFSGFERVLIYKFNEDQSGQVIAESKVDDIESYLGLYYPESDIPKQARELYKKNWIRITADARSKPIRLLPTIKDFPRPPLDMTHSLLRTMSPVHLEYLKNQGLRSSMSLSLYSHGNLWGLVICQHRDEYYLPQDMRLEVETLANLFSWQLYAKEEEALHTKRDDANAVIKEMVAQISIEKDIASIFEENEEKLLQLMNACGFVFKYADMSIAIGEVLPEVLCNKIINKTLHDKVMEEVYIDNIFELIKEERTSDILGALLLPLLPDKQYYTMWFRKEYKWERKWAGNPEEKNYAADKNERLKPRKSFVVHHETVTDEIIPWSSEDKRIADLFNKVFLQHALR